MPNNPNTFLESKKLEFPAVIGFDPLKKFQKTWLPGTQPFEPTEKGAKFFQWVSPGRKAEFLVPWDAVYTTNRLPATLHNDGTYPEFEIPHGELPEGKLVDSLDVAGKLRIVPVDQDSRSTEERLIDIEAKIDTLLGGLREKVAPVALSVIGPQLPAVGTEMALANKKEI